MQMIQKMVTQVITEKIQSVWNEEVKIKLEAGKLNPKGVTFVNYDMSSSIKNMISDYMTNSTGAFSNASGKYYNEVAKSKVQLSIPLTGSDFSQFQKKAREVSILIAGAPGGGTIENETFFDGGFRCAQASGCLQSGVCGGIRESCPGNIRRRKVSQSIIRF